MFLGKLLYEGVVVGLVERCMLEKIQSCCYWASCLRQVTALSRTGGWSREAKTRKG